MFVFGSSLVDNGNNNFLQNSFSKANYSPYGIDFPYGPSGRYTNGKNVIDLLGDKLKLPLIPVFSDPSTNGNNIVHGVNYASGGSGILDDTGSVAQKRAPMTRKHAVNRCSIADRWPLDGYSIDVSYSMVARWPLNGGSMSCLIVDLSKKKMSSSEEVITLNQQIRNFKNVTLPDLEAQLGCTSRDSLPNYLFVVGTAGNDYSAYFMSNNTNVSLEAFTDNLISLLSQKLQKLYNLGGRKFVLMSVNPLGCYPYVRELQPAGQDGCVERLNQAAALFNTRLKLMIDDIKRRQSMPYSTLVFVNAYRIITDIIRDPSSNGFNDTRSACCEVTPRSEGGTGILCKRGGRVCAERNIYVFFDGLHPTEAVNKQIATKAFASNQKDYVYPINVQQLAKL